MRFALAALLALATTACQPGAPLPAGDPSRQAAEGLDLRTDRQSYSTGEQVVLTLRNDSGEPLGVNLCLSTLEHRRNGEWVDAPRQLEEVCTALLQLLETGQTASHSFRLVPGLTAGEYRFRTRIEKMHAGAADHYASNAFQLRD
jgi:hypothetical protein